MKSLEFISIHLRNFNLMFYRFCFTLGEILLATFCKNHDTCQMGFKKLGSHFPEKSEGNHIKIVRYMLFTYHRLLANEIFRQEKIICVFPITQPTLAQT